MATHRLPARTHMPALMGPMAAAILATAIYQGREGLRELVGRMVRWRTAAS